MHRIGFRLRTAVSLAVIAAALMPPAHATSPSRAVVVSFERDPLASKLAVRDGDVASRVRWQDDAPAFRGDRRGSISAHFDARADVARLGWVLPQPLDERDSFTLYALATIEPEGFFADPNGYFQISWGLWNSATTGTDRTGSPDNFAADSFDLVEFNYFPNESPFFGGPFVTPTVLGGADRKNPLFEFLGAFANSSFGSSQVSLPLGVPLLIATRHDAEQQALTTRVWRIASDGSLEEIVDARAQAPLATLSRPQFTLDRFGLTLWHDGFSGETPALDARVTFQGLGVWIGGNATAEDLLSATVRNLK